MRKGWLVVPVAMALAGAVGATFVMQKRVANATQADGAVVLPNGWAVTPAGRPIALMGDLPTKMAWTADGSRLIVITSGWHNQSISLIDPKDEKIVQALDLGSAWAGLALDGEDVYVSGGKSGFRKVSIGKDTLEKGDASDAQRDKKPWTSGLAVVGKDLFALDLNNHSVVRYSLPDLKRTGDLNLGKAYPYCIAASPDQKQLAITDTSGDRVIYADAATLSLVGETKGVERPNELVWAKDGRLFVCSTATNSVKVILSGKVVETVKTCPDPKDLMGSTPDALALSPDGKTLYVANADNNDVAVIDVSQRESKVRGFIPTGWYPSALAVSPDGKKLFVGTGKGLTFGPNGTVNAKGKISRKYIASLLRGHVSVVDVPTDAELTKYTARVLANMPRPATTVPTYDTKLLKTMQKIKHVVYVIRENRTYDQVLGDMEKGNGDKGLCMFGEEVTPNAHALAREFVLLDNLYCNGEVSQDGHQWCNAAYATEYTQKSWTNSYSGRGEPDDDDGKLANSPAGYLWDNCQRQKKSYYSYGEFASFKSDPNSPPQYSGTPGLEGHASLKWAQSKRRDMNRIDTFIDDLRDAEKTGKWHDFMVMSLGEDHTKGARAGEHTPRACVASNDVAIGKMVDAISHSKFWAETAIFIIEDDAQDGPDHVDAHRTVGLVISPYTRRGALDSTLYTTASFLRTMELILGLKPMTQFDDRATPMWSTFTAQANLKAYDALPARIDVDAKNPAKTALAARSEKLNWTKFDEANPWELNAILWEMHFPNRPMPAPVRSARIR